MGCISDALHRKTVKTKLNGWIQLTPCQEKLKEQTTLWCLQDVVLMDCTILTSGNRLSNGCVTNVGDRLEKQQRVIQNVKIVLAQLQIIKGAKPSFEAL